MARSSLSIRRQLTLASLLLLALPALASSGWYLLIPETSSFNEKAEYLSGYQVLDDRPISQWVHYRAFDSAEACEAGREALIISEQSFYAKISDEYLAALQKDEAAATTKHKRRGAETANARVNAAMASRCVKSDDPRLAK